ncbi:site-2 protease family protein [Streptomyces sp. MMS24-I31]|uniref:site-2 protease family protein n=1 Tax=Streptomyces sp. MMS24-I31 TaxID=3351563 RepID=UPI003896A8AE
MSGGSGQPRSGNDESAERHTGPAAGTERPGTGPAPRGSGPGECPAGQAHADAAGRAKKAEDPERGDADEARAATPEPGAPVTAGEPSPDPGAPGTAGPAGDDDPTGHPVAHPVRATAAQEEDRSGGTAPATDGGDATGPASAPDRSTGAHPDTHPDRDHAHSADAHPHTPVRAPVEHDSHPDRTLAHSGTGRVRPPRRPREPGGGLLMGRPFGVPVYVAPSWFLVAALITWVFGGQLDRVLPGLGVARYLVALFFAVAFYGSVLVHELAHTIAALRFKLPVRRIQLQFFGGVSEIEKEAETPGREFVLAFVGPLLSLILAGLFYLALQPVERGSVPGVLLAGLMISNLIVAVFNLLPGLPLDGGRMLRAVVWKITGRPMSGTVAAAWVGRALAVSVLIGLPLLTQSGSLGTTAENSVGMDTVTDALLAAILAAIIWTGAGNSLRMARLREHLPELRARNLTRRAVPVETNTSLAEALRRANAAGARALVVVDGHGEPLSLVRESAIAGVPEHRRPWVYASELAQDLTDGMRVSAELAGEDLLDVLRATPATEYLVVEETGEIYGVLSAGDVERAFVKAMARPQPS